MRIRRTVPALAAASLAIGALAFAPASVDEVTEDAAVVAETGTGDEETYGPCEDRADGVTVLTPEAFYDQVVPTPVGAVGSTQADAVVIQVSLEGQPVGTPAELALELDWDTPELGDYDLITNGDNLLDTAQPERKTLPVFHCAVVDIDTEVFIGTPLDTLVLTADVAVD